MESRLSLSERRGGGPPFGDVVPAARFGPAAAWSIALVAFGIAVGIRALLDPILGAVQPLVTLYGAVAVSVWAGGWLPGLVGALAAYFACSYFFISPRGSIAFENPADAVGFVAYLFTCGMILWIGEAMRSAHRQASEDGSLLRLTLGSIGDGVITTDVEGCVTSMNRVAERLTGWRTDEAAGRSLDEVFRIVDEAGRQPLESPAKRALREGSIVGLANHTVLIARDGVERPIDDSAAPIRDERGRVSGCVLTFRDVGERRRVERAEAEQLATARRLAAIVESSDDAIVSKSLEGVIQSWNAGAERLFGYSPDEAVGRHISLIIPTERLSEEDQILATLRAGRRIEHFETVRQRKDGSRLAVSLTVSPIRDESGRVMGASKIVRDVTDRRRLEDELRRLAISLAADDRRKNEFLATLSHELRNPLAPMRNTIELLKRSGDDRERFGEALQTMERQLDLLVRLVDDLLDLSRITHDRIDLRRTAVDLEPLLRQTVEAARPFAESGGLALVWVSTGEPVPVHADPVRLNQVFGNLLNNGTKYTPPGGTITLVLERRGKEAVVTVRDTGKGVPREKLESIFEMFARVERSTEPGAGGLGIGLTLVKRLVELHGGTVEARSPGEGKGSEFEVRLPIHEPEARAAAAAAPQSRAEVESSGRGRRVLVVDDNVDSALSLATLLRMTGFKVEASHDGQEALVAMEKGRPEIVLLDIGLPRLDGFEVARRVRAEPWGRGMRLVALTGWGQDEDRRRSEEAGFDAHLVKPVDFDELLKILG